MKMTKKPLTSGLILTSKKKRILLSIKTIKVEES